MCLQEHHAHWSLGFTDSTESLDEWGEVKMLNIPLTFSSSAEGPYAMVIVVLNTPHAVLAISCIDFILFYYNNTTFLSFAVTVTCQQLVQTLLS